MPKPHQVFQHWNNESTKIFEDGFPEMQCFACGYSGILERSHILAIHYGGSNELDNIHMLCRFCHFESEALCGEAYWTWLRHKYLNFYDFGLSHIRAKVEVIFEFMKQNRISCPEEGCRRFHELR